MLKLSSRLRVDIPPTGRFIVGSNSFIGERPNDSSDRRISFGIEDCLYQPVSIGHNTLIREHCLVDLGIKRSTVIGHNVYVHSRCTISHDCIVEDDVVLAPSVTLSGSCIVMRYAQVGASSVLHQNTVIGSYAMIGMGSVVTKDIPPFVIAFGSPCTVRKINSKKTDSIYPLDKLSKLFASYLQAVKSGNIEKFCFGVTALDRSLETFLNTSTRSIAT